VWAAPAFGWVHGRGHDEAKGSAMVGTPCDGVADGRAMRLLALGR
jgi:hypothetical protein